MTAAAPATPCRHCRKRPGEFARGLCRVCWRFPSVRAMYVVVTPAVCRSCRKSFGSVNRAAYCSDECRRAGHVRRTQAWLARHGAEYTRRQKGRRVKVPAHLDWPQGYDPTAAEVEELVAWMSRPENLPRWWPPPGQPDVEDIVKCDLRVCQRCRKTRRIVSRDMCRACYEKWRRTRKRRAAKAGA